MRISDWSSDVCSSDLQTMHLEDPVDAQGAVLQMPQGLHHRVVVEDHLLASITRLAPRASISFAIWRVVDAPSSCEEAMASSIRRSDERRVGKECVSTCSYRCSPYP